MHMRLGEHNRNGVHVCRLMRIILAGDPHVNVNIVKTQFGKAQRDKRYDFHVVEFYLWSLLFFAILKCNINQ